MLRPKQTKFFTHATKGSKFRGRGLTTGRILGFKVNNTVWRQARSSNNSSRQAAQQQMGTNYWNDELIITPWLEMGIQVAQIDHRRGPLPMQWDTNQHFQTQWLGNWLVKVRYFGVKRTKDPSKPTKSHSPSVVALPGAPLTTKPIMAPTKALWTFVCGLRIPIGLRSTEVPTVPFVSRTSWRPTFDDVGWP